MKVLLLAVLRPGGKAKVHLAVMAAIVVAVAKAQAWQLQLHLRGLLQHMERHLICRREYGQLQVWASAPGSSPGGVGDRTGRAVHAAAAGGGHGRLLVAEFLVLLELEWFLLVSEEPNLAGAAFPFLGGAGGGAIDHSEILVCGGRWICGPQQPGLVFDLVLTPGSILEVTTVDRAGIVDGTTLLCGGDHVPPRRASCVRFGGASSPARAREWSGVFQGIKSKATAMARKHCGTLGQYSCRESLGRH